MDRSDGGIKLRHKGHHISMLSHSPLKLSLSHSPLMRNRLSVSQPITVSSPMTNLNPSAVRKEGPNPFEQAVIVTSRRNVILTKTLGEFQV